MVLDVFPRCGEEVCMRAVPAGASASVKVRGSALLNTFPG